MLARNIHDEDTIELQLSAAELQWLTQAQSTAEGEAARPAPPTMTAPVPQNAEPAPVSTEVAATAAGPPIEAAPANAGPPMAAMPATAAPVVEPPIAAASAAAAPVIEPLIAASQASFVLATAALGRPAVAHSTPDAPAAAAALPAPVPLRLVPASPSRAPAALPERTPTKIQVVSSSPVPRPPERHVPVGLRTAAVLVGVAVLVALVFWPRTPAPASVTTPTPAPAATAPLREPLPGAHPPSASAESLSPDPTAPVRFANPFDPTEVFEFPAGTSYVDARDQVAQRLIARARERTGAQNSAANSQNRAMNGASLARQL